MFFIWVLNNNCKIPQHILKIEVANGHSKHIALFLTLKKLYESGHVWNKRIALSSIQWNISRNTYNKYLDILTEMGWVKPEGNGYRLIGMTTLLKLYPIKDKERLKISNIENGKDLRRNIEKEVIRITISAEQNKANSSKLDITKTPRLVRKTVRGIKSLYQVQMEREVSLSQQTMAAKLGFKQRHTARKRQKIWVKEKFIDCVYRVMMITKAEAYEVVNEVKKMRKSVFRKGNCFFQVLANEITIRDNSFGRKLIPINLQTKGYCNEIWEENF